MAPPPSVPASVLQPRPQDHHWTRVASLAGAAIVALSAGSNYAFSSFAPQIQEVLHLTSTQINIIGLAGNMGVYLSGPLWGTWVDGHGPRLALTLAAFLVALGYGGLSFFAPNESRANSVAAEHAPPSTGSVTVLAPLFFALSTGVGNSGALAASMNAQAKSWGRNRRGTATGIVLGGFGLSAAFFSTLSSTFFADSPGYYLRSIASISFCTFIAGAFVIRILPPVHHHHHHHHHHHANARSPQDTPHSAEQAPVNNRVRTLSAAQFSSRSRSRSMSMSRPYIRRRTTSEVSALPWSGTSVVSEQASSESESEHEPLADDVEAAGGYGTIGREGRNRTRSGTLLNHSLPTGTPLPEPQDLDITGWNLLKDLDFWILFALMAIVSGVGLLLINNVGSMVQTLYRAGLKDPKAILLSDEDDMAVPLAQEVVASLTGGFVTFKGGKKRRSRERAAEVHRLQAQQVTAISIGNAVGRIAIGVLADLAVSLVDGQEEVRVWLLAPVCAMAVASQTFAAYPGAVSTVGRLVVLSGSTGLMYGTLFGICPSLNLSFFGLINFSANWGILSLAPVLAGNTFNLIFGYVYDSHVRQSPSGHECFDGEECYRDTFVITAFSAVAACGLAAALIWRRGRLTFS